MIQYSAVNRQRQDRALPRHRDYWVARAQLERAVGGRLRMAASPPTPEPSGSVASSCGSTLLSEESAELARARENVRRRYEARLLTLYG